LPSGVLAAPIRPHVKVPPVADGHERPVEIIEALARFKEGDIDAALDLCKSAARQYPFLPPPRLMLANMYLTGGRPDEGRTVLERAAAEHPDDPEVFLIFGELLASENRMTEAAVLLEKAAALLTKFNRDATRKSQLALRLIKTQATTAEARGDWEAAQKHLAAWRRLAPSDAQAANRLGRALFYIERPREAFTELREAAKLSDELPAAEVSMGLLYERAKDRDRAARFMARAVESAPKSYPTRVGVAQWCWDTGQMGELAAHANAALAIDPRGAAAHRLRGLAAMAQNAADTAQTHFETALASDPGDFTSADYLALILAEKSDKESQRRALELATLAARTFAGRNDAVITLAWVQLAQGDAPAANRTLRGVDWRRSLSRDSAYRAARIAGAVGDTASAKKLVQTALESGGPFLNEREAVRWLNQWTAAGKARGKS